MFELFESRGLMRFKYSIFDFRSTDTHMQGSMHAARVAPHLDWRATHDELGIFQLVEASKLAGHRCRLPLAPHSSRRRGLRSCGRARGCLARRTGSAHAQRRLLFGNCRIEVVKGRQLSHGVVVEQLYLSTTFGACSIALLPTRVPSPAQQHWLVFARLAARA